MSDIAKHTSAPWTADLDQNFTLGGDTVCVEAVTGDGARVLREICTCPLDTDEHPDGEGYLEDAANVRLITAAPDLLDACNVALGHFTGGMDGDYRNCDYVALIKAAIDKAAGK